MRARVMGRFLRVASVVVAVVLLVLTGVVVVGVSSIRQSQRETEHLAAVVTAWRDIQLAVSEEAFAEAGYRRAPSDAARDRLDAAIAAVPVKMDAAREIGDRRDATTLSYLGVLNDRYVSEVRRTLDEAPVVGQDDRVAGPALDAMAEVLAGAVQGHRDRAAEARADQARTATLVFWLVPLSTLIAVVALGLCWVVLVRAHRRLLVDASANALRASQDPLTGLANRSRLRADFDYRLAAGRSGAIVLVDLDRFKEVNDTLGHQAGDALLVAVAEHLGGLVRGSDLVARLGGDEFVLLLDDPDAVDAVTGRLVAGVADLALAYDVGVGASVGAARWPEDGSRYEELVQVADVRLYEDKRARRAARTADGSPAVPAPRGPVAGVS